jgi:myo-inositol-1(or 4)-monophosphatase
MDEAQLLPQVESIMRAAGDIILAHRFKPLQRVEKKGAGFVTVADTESEAYLIEHLSKLIPGIGFFAEENGHKQGSNDYCWVIDPLDGTTNFAYGLPHFCISVALTYKNKPLLGCVYQPLLNEFFWAIKGKGAWLNGKPIHVSQVRRIQESFLLFCIPYNKNEGSKKLFDTVLTLSQQTYSMRLLGAAALDQSYVAAGRLDGMFFEQLSWWDVAAAALVIEEAGGRVSDYEGNQLTPHFTSFVAGNPYIHEKLVKMFNNKL